jgi:hypothetical protein
MKLDKRLRDMAHEAGLWEMRRLRRRVNSGDRLRNMGSPINGMTLNEALDFIYSNGFDAVMNEQKGDA